MYHRRSNGGVKRSEKPENYVEAPNNGVVRKGKGFLHRIIYDPRVADKTLFAKIELSCRKVITLAEDFRRWDDYKIEELTINIDSSVDGEKPSGTVSYGIVTQCMDNVREANDAIVDIVSVTGNFQHKKFGQKLSLNFPRNYRRDANNGCRTTKHGCDYDLSEVGSLVVMGHFNPDTQSIISIYVAYKISFRNDTDNICNKYKLLHDAADTIRINEPHVFDSSYMDRDKNSTGVLKSGNSFYVSLSNEDNDDDNPAFAKIPLSCREVGELAPYFEKWEEYRIEHLQIQVYGHAEGVPRADRGSFAWGVLLDNFTISNSHSLELIDHLKTSKFQGEHKYGDCFNVDMNKTYLIDTINRGWRGTHCELDQSAKELGHLLMLETTRPKVSSYMDIYISYTIRFRSGAPKNNSVLYELWPDYILNPKLTSSEVMRLKDVAYNLSEYDHFLKEGTGYLGRLVFYPDHPNTTIFTKIPLSCRDVMSVAGYFSEWSEYRVEYIHIDMYSSSRGGSNGLYKYGIIMDRHDLGLPDIDEIEGLLFDADIKGANAFGDDSSIEINFNHLTDNMNQGWRSTSNRATDSEKEVGYLYLIGVDKPIGISTINMRVKYKIRFRGEKDSTVTVTIPTKPINSIKDELNKSKGVDSARRNLMSTFDAVEERQGAKHVTILPPIESVAETFLTPSATAFGVVTSRIQQDEVITIDRGTSEVSTGSSAAMDVEMLSIGSRENSLTVLENVDVSTVFDEHNRIIETGLSDNPADSMTVDQLFESLEKSTQTEFTLPFDLVARNGDNGMLPINLAATAKVCLKDITDMASFLPPAPKIIKLVECQFRYYESEGKLVLVRFSHVMWNPYAKRSFFMPIYEDDSGKLKVFMGIFHSGSHNWLYQLVIKNGVKLDFVADNLPQYNIDRNPQLKGIIKSMVDSHGNVINMALFPDDLGRSEWRDTIRKWRVLKDGHIDKTSNPKSMKVQKLYTCTCITFQKLVNYFQAGYIHAIEGEPELVVYETDGPFVWPEVVKIGDDITGLYFKTCAAYPDKDADICSSTCYRIDAVIGDTVLCSVHKYGYSSLPRIVENNTLHNFDNNTLNGMLSQ